MPRPTLLNTFWVNILATATLLGSVVLVVAYSTFSESRPDGSTLLYLAITISLVLLIFMIIRLHFLILSLKNGNWPGVILTVIQIGFLGCLLYAFLVALAVSAGIIGVSTNPPY
ncbi:MAG: hypothetical protein L6Q97_13860 [Thermoanaerobaculia bacterium]|nr:hypothetical protein [Thermoanaerobaculia bacterium]